MEQQYLIGSYIIDASECTLLNKADRSLISDNDRIVTLLLVLARAYPRVVPRAELLDTIWPTKEVTDWALSRLIADTRSLLNEDSDEESQILKTVHGKGFRLAIPVHVIAGEKEDHAAGYTARWIKPTLALSRQAKFVVGTFLIFITVSTIFVLNYIKRERFKEVANDNNYTPQQLARINLPGQRRDSHKKIETLSMIENWSAADSLEIDFHDGVSFSPTDSMQWMGYEYFGPVNLNKATVLFEISVDERYINSGAGIQLYSLLLFGNWRGEWDCIIENNQLSLQRKIFECKLEEPGDIFNIAPKESLRIGLRSLADSSIQGTIKVYSVRIKYAKNFMDSDWLTSSASPVTYHGGVQFAPQDGGEILEFKYNGPQNFQGAKLIFTVEASQEFIDSGATILPYAQMPGGKWQGEWGCWVPNSDLSPFGSRLECLLDEPNDIFNLNEQESLLIGIMSQRGEGKMAGTVKIKNIEIIFPQ